MSALQHLSFCPRQCALIHVDRVWADNVRTVEGTLLHERADRPGGERRPEVRAERALWLRSERLRLVGRADVVEFVRDDRGRERVHPVEYKRGRRGEWGHDEVQLCAQAIALEEMMGVTVESGALYHGKSRRRREVVFSPALRARTERLARELHAMVRGAVVPAAEYGAKCEECSLKQACMPKVRLDASGYIRSLIRGTESE
ncbi:MAG: CRISPR-associated protein Cas4 [Myxococcales bacterium]|nr:CRISPR-associated protein Cas4 [Myxococcales bacterium]